MHYNSSVSLHLFLLNSCIVSIDYYKLTDMFILKKNLKLLEKVVQKCYLKK